jgi:hypothetical protein
MMLLPVAVSRHSHPKAKDQGSTIVPRDSVRVGLGAAMRQSKNLLVGIRSQAAEVRNGKGKGAGGPRATGQQ